MHWPQRQERKRNLRGDIIILNGWRVNDFKGSDIFVVQYSTKQMLAAFICVNKRGIWDFNEGSVTDYEIIGNIYENPELLNCFSKVDR